MLYNVQQAILAKIPMPIYGLLIKLVAPRALKAIMADKQTAYTRAVRALWRAL